MTCTLEIGAPTSDVDEPRDEVLLREQAESFNLRMLDCQHRWGGFYVITCEGALADLERWATATLGEGNFTLTVGRDTLEVEY